MLLSWRGETYEVQIEPPATYGPLRGTNAAVWRPDAPSDFWRADFVAGDIVAFKAVGETPQAALDALAAIVPAVPVSKGGAC